MTETDTIEQYVAFWNAATAEEQRRLAAATFSDQVSYHAPAGVMRGVDELIAFRDAFAQNSPDYVFRPRAEPQAHHGRARLRWELVVAGDSFATGTDVLELDDQGHIIALTTFLDRAPEGFAHAGH
ncbi:MAG TPA: nuclear transport factor 2 family protein [Streptosporangiaceae bacterium]|nr:nuclear transport factor 2 family protein [Streptosporangiaceae bacterium]